MSHAIVLVALDNASWIAARGQSAIEAAVQQQMAPFDEDGEWFSDGSRWDWWIIGGRYSGFFGAAPDWRLRSELSAAARVEYLAVRARARWNEAETSKDDPAIRSLIYGIESEHSTEETYVAACVATGFSTFAFLRNRVWHERARMGWFGSAAATECEVRGADEPTICKFSAPDGEAQVLSYGGLAEGRWEATFFDRFLAKLPGDSLLVAVDYHV